MAVNEENDSNKITGFNGRAFISYAFTEMEYEHLQRGCKAKSDFPTTTQL